MLAISTICFYTDKECIFPRYFQCDHLLLKEGNGNPLQYSCLENSVDGGTWWVAVRGVVQGRTWLKRLSMRACIGEGIDNPLQYCCLENPRDGGAWWAAVCGVIQSWTWLKLLSSSSSTSCWKPAVLDSGHFLSVFTGHWAALWEVPGSPLDLTIMWPQKLVTLFCLLKYLMTQILSVSWCVWSVEPSDDFFFKKSTFLLP